MYEWCKEIGIPTVVVATKGDKIARGRWLQHTKVIRQHLNMRGDDTILIFSSETGQGRDELWSEIKRRLYEYEEAKREQAKEEKVPSSAEQAEGKAQ